MKHFLLILFCISQGLLATTHTVGQGNEYDFQSIQSAINYATHYDSIIVNPGTYYENIDFLQKSLFLGSLFSVTRDTTYISQTIIDAQKNGRVVTIRDVEQATLEGFTIQNGLANSGIDDWSFIASDGGGIELLRSSSIISFNMIINNYAYIGGGISSPQSNIELRGNIITRNSAQVMAGGLYFGGTPDHSVFDTEQKNSIYNNVAHLHGDIYFASPPPLNLHIPLKKITYPHNNHFSIYASSGNEAPNFSYSFEETSVQEVNANLYVAPYGSDANSGLSESDPLQTITAAIFKIASDSVDIKTIYVANGTYSVENGELMPLSLKRFMRVIGQSKENTIIDCGSVSNSFVSGSWESRYNQYLPETWRAYDNITLENFTIRNCFDETWYPYTSAIKLTGYAWNNVYHISNIIFDNTVGGPLAPGFLHSNWMTGKISNIYIKRGIRTLDEVGWNPAFMLGLPVDVIMENVIIDGGNAGIFMLTSWDVVNQPSNITISNIVIKDMTSYYTTGPEWGPYDVNVMWLENDSGAGDNIVRLVNSTIINNRGRNGIISLNNTRFEMYNTIIYNNSPNKIFLGKRGSGNIGGSSLFSNNLFNDNMIIDYSSYIWQHEELDNIYENPLFIGTGNHPEQLAAGSLAIDAGTIDIPDYTFPEFDLAGNPRIHNGQVDIGAYENQTSSNYDLVVEKPITQITVYPNPFKVSAGGTINAKINLIVAESSDMSLSIFNIKGQKVKTIMSGYTREGGFSTVWNGLDENNKAVGAGVYLFKATINDKEVVQKFTILK